MDRCGVVSRAAPCRENEAAEPTSARATMERYSIVGVSVTMWLSKVGAEWPERHHERWSLVGRNMQHGLS